MSVDTCVFEVDACAAVLANNDLKLVIPSVRASTDLNTLLDLAGTAKHVHAKFGCVGWLSVVETKNEQCTVDDVEAVAVVRALILAQDLAKSRPNLAVLSAENTKSALGCVVNGGLFCVLNNGLQVGAHVSFGHDEIVVVVKNVEPVELTLAKNDDVFAARVLANLASIVGGNASSTEQARVLVHAERLSTQRVWREFLFSYGSCERKRGYYQGGSTCDLVVAGGRRVIFKKEERVEVQDDGVVEVEVGVVPFIKSALVSQQMGEIYLQNCSI